MPSKKIICILLLLLSLAGCQGDKSDKSSLKSQIEDMDMVITAQQGRIQELEKSLQEMDAKMLQLEQQVSLKQTEMNAGQLSSQFDGVLKTMESRSEEMLRFLFVVWADTQYNSTAKTIEEAFANSQYDVLNGLIEKYDSVYALNDSTDLKKGLVWVTDGESHGDVYIYDQKDETHKASSLNMKPLGFFENLKMTHWDHSGRYVILETETDSVRKGHLMSVDNLMRIASMEYSDMPVWSPNDQFFVYLFENPNIVYTSKTKQMHPAGVFLFNMKTQKFETVDSGGNDYTCAELSIAQDGEIRYIRNYTDGREAHNGVYVKQE